MSDTLGARLRRQREQRQITLATIAEQTKIKVSLLEHLERDDVSQWPAGIFRRAFVRSYAKAIGLDPEVVVREFVALHPDPDDVAAAPADGASIDGGAPCGSPPTRLRSLVGSAIGSLGRRRSAGGDAQRPADRQASVAPPSGPEPAKAAAVDDRIAPQPDFLAAANVCIELGQVSELSDAAPVLREAARILGANGLIVWLWHPRLAALTAALAHGYSAAVVAQLPRVGRDWDNATAAAFRSGETHVVNGSGAASGALAVPLLTVSGCAGVLAIELHDGAETRESVRALAAIFAAQLARVVPAPRPANAVERRRA